jgi:hypothetical protein
MHRGNFIDISLIHERINSNIHAYDLAKSSLDLSHGRRVWLLQSPDIMIVPMFIE